MFALPGYVWVLILTGAILLRTLIPVGLYRSALGAGLSRRTATTVAAGTAALLFAWLAADALLAYNGAFQTGIGVPVAVFGALAVLLAMTRIPVMTRVLASPEVTARLALPHVVRWVGGVFLIVMLLGKLPALFAIPAAIGDMSVAAAAPFVARALMRGTGHRQAIWFNVLGLVDEIVALGTGALAGSGLVHAGSSTAALGLLPLILIPTTGVPLNAATSIVSLRRLIAKPMSSRLQGGMATASP